MGGRVAILIAAMVASADTALAQDSYNTIYGFGDSYADTNEVPGGIFNFPGGLEDPPIPAPGFPPEAPLGRFSDGLNFVDRLADTYNASAVNFAFGGAMTGEFGLSGDPVGFLSQVERLFPTQSYNPDDLIAISIGGNNTTLLLNNPALDELNDEQAAATGQDFAIASAAEVGAGVQSLVDRGARTISYFSVGGFTEDGVSFYPDRGADPTSPRGIAAGTYLQTFLANVETELAGIAAQGVRVNFFNFAELQRRIFEGNEWKRFDFTKVGEFGIPSTAIPESIPCPPGAATCNPADAEGYFYWDSVHLTESAYNLAADFMTIQLVQNETIPVQADLAQIQALNFTETLMQRIHARRDGASGLSASLSAKDYVDPKALSWKDDPAPFVSHNEFALFVAGGYAAGDRDARDGIVGFDYDLRNIVVGGDYKLGEFTHIGAAVGYTNSSADYSFLRGFGDTELDSVNLGAYASLAYPNFFADLAIAYSINDYDMDRTGIVSPFGTPIPLDVAGETEGDSFVADFRTGYLFNAAPALDIGPIAGLSYSNVTVDGYTESGDSLLTLNVEEQTLESLIGSVGVMMRYKSGGIEPYLAVTLEKELLDDRDYSFALTSAPEVVNTVDVGDDNDPYGRVRAGVKAELSDSLIGSIDGSATFGRETGDDYAISGALKFRF